MSVHGFRSHFGHWLEPLFGPTLFDLKSWTEICVRITISVHDCGPKLDLWPHNFGPRPWTEICCPFLISVHGRGPKSFGPQNFGPRPWTEFCWPFLISVHDCGPKSNMHQHAYCKNHDRNIDLNTSCNIHPFSKYNVNWNIFLVTVIVHVDQNLPCGLKMPMWAETRLWGHVGIHSAINNDTCAWTPNSAER